MQNLWRDASRVMKRNESVKNLGLGRSCATRRGVSLGWTAREISTPRWSVNGPIDTKARIKRRWLFHLRAEISFAHLGTCRRRRRLDERARIERVLTRMLKRKGFWNSRARRLTVTRSAITICYCILAITWWLLTNRISSHLNSGSIQDVHYPRESSAARCAEALA